MHDSSNPEFSTYASTARAMKFKIMYMHIQYRAALRPALALRYKSGLCIIKIVLCTHYLTQNTISANDIIETDC